MRDDPSLDSFHNPLLSPFLGTVGDTVGAALAEDVGGGDITAELIPAGKRARARVICREHAVICGRPWVDEVFRQVDAEIQADWHCAEGEAVGPDQEVFSVEGPARGLLTAERSALNFLQTLSGTATRASALADLVRHTGVKILDTRKTLPGLRLAQKYAVRQGGCHNHRIGLFDAYLIKENHIAACGGIAEAVTTARRLHEGKTVEIEVESHAQLEQALQAGADVVMLDNFSLQDIRAAVKHVAGRTKLEASGGYDEASLVAVAEAGVDYISVGSLTKHCRAVDFSMRFL